MILYVAKKKGEFYTMLVGELVHISANKDYTLKLEDGSQIFLENDRDTFRVFKNIDDCSEFIYQKNGFNGYEDKRVQTFKRR